MPDLPRYIVGIDPGLMTGWAVLRHNDDDTLTVIDSAELDMYQFGERLADFLDVNKDDAAEIQIVVERFLITEKTARNSQAPWSLMVIGVADWLVYQMWGEPDRITRQGPAEAKTLITNVILRRAKTWHKGGAGHANDAIRHAVYRYAKLGLRNMWDT